MPLILFLVSCFLFLVFSPLPAAAASSNLPSSEEQAVYNLNQGLIPEEMIPPPREENFFSSIANAIQQTFGSLFNLPQFFSGSQVIHQATVPTDLNQNSSQALKNSDQQVLGTTDPLQQLKGFLGGSTGFYGVLLPKEIQGKSVRDTEKSFEKANFPEGINPVTGQ